MFHFFSRAKRHCSRAKQRERKMCAARAYLLFCLLASIDFVAIVIAVAPLSLHDFIFLFTSF